MESFEKISGSSSDSKIEDIAGVNREYDDFKTVLSSNGGYFSSATSPEDLERMLSRTLIESKSTGKLYTGEKIMEIINNGDDFNKIPRTGGLRDKVKELYSGQDPQNKARLN